jgi:hypothetical protein
MTTLFMNGESYTARKIDRENLQADADQDISDCLARPKARMRAWQIMLQLNEVDSL